MIKMFVRMTKNCDAVTIASADLYNLACELADAKDLLREAKHMLERADISEAYPRVQDFAIRLDTAIGHRTEDMPENLYDRILQLEDELYNAQPAIEKYDQERRR